MPMRETAETLPTSEQSVRSHMLTRIARLEKDLDALEAFGGQHHRQCVKRRLTQLHLCLRQYLLLEEELLEPALVQDGKSARGRDARARRHDVLRRSVSELQRLLHMEFPYLLLEGVSDLRVLLEREHEQCGAELHEKLDRRLSTPEQAALVHALCALELEEDDELS